MNAPSSSLAPGVHKVARLTLTAPDLEAARAFYTAFGLNVRERAGGLDVQADASTAPELRIVEAARGGRRVRELSFEADEAGFAAVLRAAEASGARCAPPPWAETEALWLADPDDNIVSVHKAPAPASHPIPPLALNSPAPARRNAVEGAPMRLSHVMFHTPDVSAAIAFYTGVLGVRLSDRAADIVAFTHGAHGGDHHMVAFAKSSAPAFHHCSWQMPTLDSVGLGARRVQEAGYMEGWGVGRHVLGSNYFYYARDPWGGYSEFSYGIDQIAPDKAWVAGDHAPEDALYLWGPDVPAYFLENPEAA